MAKAKKDKSQNPEDEDIENGDEETPDEQPEPEAAAEAPAPEETAEAPATEADPEAGEPESTPSGSHKITIEGEGPIAFHVDGAVHYSERGKQVKVTDDELAALRAAGIALKKGK